MQKLLTFILTFISLAAAAQTTMSEPAGGQAAGAASVTVRTDSPAVSQPSFGYLSYDSVLHAMPAYASACRQMEALRAKYDAEARRVEDDFNKKYEEFLEGQRDFPATILQKRQSELQELLDRNIQFREESRRLLEAAEKDIFAPLHGRIRAALGAIGEERGYAFIINTDNNACPFISTVQGDNVGPVVSERLK